jgi:hypothetical protein
MEGCRAGGLLAAAVMAASSLAEYILMRRIRSLMIAQGLHEKARPAEKTVPGISNLMNAKASPRRDGEG